MSTDSGHENGPAEENRTPGINIVGERMRTSSCGRARLSAIGHARSRLSGRWDGQLRDAHHDEQGRRQGAELGKATVRVEVLREDRPIPVSVGAEGKGDRDRSHLDRRPTHGPLRRGEWRSSRFD